MAVHQARPRHSAWFPFHVLPHLEGGRCGLGCLGACPPLRYLTLCEHLSHTSDPPSYVQLQAQLVPEPPLLRLALPGLHSFLLLWPSGRPGPDCVPAAAWIGTAFRARTGEVPGARAPDPCLGTSCLLVLAGRPVLHPVACHFLVLLTLCPAGSGCRAFPDHSWEPSAIL